MTLIVFSPRFCVEGIDSVAAGAPGAAGAPSTRKTRRSLAFKKANLNLHRGTSLEGREDNVLSKSTRQRGRERRRTPPERSLTTRRTEPKTFWL